MLELVVPALVAFGVFGLFWGVVATGAYFGILPLTLVNYSAEVKIVSFAGVLALGLMTKFFEHYWRHRMMGWSFSFKRFFRDEVVWRYKTPISLDNGKKNVLVASFEGILYFSLYQSLIIAIFFTFGVFWFALEDTNNQFGARDEFELFDMILRALRSGDWGSIEEMWGFYVEMLRRPAPKFGFGLASSHLLGVIVGSCAAAWKMSLRLGGIKNLPMLLLVLLVSVAGVGLSDFMTNSVEFAVRDSVKQKLSEELRIELPAGLYAAISDLKVGEELWFSCPHAAEDNPARDGWMVTELKRDANQSFVPGPPPNRSLADCKIRITNGEVNGETVFWITAPPSIHWKLLFTLTIEIDARTKFEVVLRSVIGAVLFASAWFLLALLPAYFTLKFSRRVRDAVVLKTAVDFLPSTKRREVLATVEGEVRKAMVERLQKQPDNSM